MPAREGQGRVGNGLRVSTIHAAAPERTTQHTAARLCTMQLSTPPTAEGLVWDEVLRHTLAAQRLAVLANRKRISLRGRGEGGRHGELHHQPQTQAVPHAAAARARPAPPSAIDPFSPFAPAHPPVDSFSKHTPGPPPRPLREHFPVPPIMAKTAVIGGFAVFYNGRPVYEVSLLTVSRHTRPHCNGSLIRAASEVLLLPI